ncbi:hypothetical protein M427DRAFT_67341 [Gonapodya prolifera JEL478]|uniref:Uncharacterized protein n=1 Tax=Gonapodya prolifera (strain JEL478) TaxID=1344416 RepID=A0A139AR77_GONPJ|nr:hypothetical protein M427DRAFT_67341 [Gonapodya prolifera JEL478]|eukprot:KXS19222.1 hypothetical protein M427DRAFT_67341 [Gonapodya prolifera JEL478]
MLAAALNSDLIAGSLTFALPSPSSGAAVDAFLRHPERAEENDATLDRDVEEREERLHFRLLDAMEGGLSGKYTVDESNAILLAIEREHSQIEQLKTQRTVGSLAAAVPALGGTTVRLPKVKAKI